jgi:hypothetical protein
LWGDVSYKISSAITKFPCNYVNNSNSKTQKNTGASFKSSMKTAGFSNTHLLRPKLRIILKNPKWLSV